VLCYFSRYEFALFSKVAPRLLPFTFFAALPWSSTVAGDSNAPAPTNLCVHRLFILVANAVVCGLRSAAPSAVASSLSAFRPRNHSRVAGQWC